MYSGNEDSKVPSERKKSVYTDGFSKSGKNKRIASTTPNFKKLRETRFKEMESIDQYVKRKKKHFEQHNLLNELKVIMFLIGLRYLIFFSLNSHPRTFCFHCF